MFTGLIQETGLVVTSEQRNRKIGTARRITIAAKKIAQKVKLGDSVAVSGVCLTAIDVKAGCFSADLARETLERTSLGSLQPNAMVNLELPANAGDPLGGHIVQGHVDDVGKLLSLEKVKGHEDWRLTIALPPALRKHVVSQGSITIEGISLTVASMSADAIEIAIIPHTHAVTNLHTLRVGSPVNVETDVLAKYAERISRQKAPGKLTIAGLIKIGF